MVRRLRAGAERIRTSSSAPDRQRFRGLANPPARRSHPSSYRLRVKPIELSGGGPRSAAHRPNQVASPRARCRHASASRRRDRRFEICLPLGGLCAKIGLFQSSRSGFRSSEHFCTKTHCWRVESCAQPQAAVLARHGHRRSPRPEHRYLAISKSAHRAAGLRRIVCGTRCAVFLEPFSEYRPLARGQRLALSSARPKRLFGSVGGRPAPARWLESGRLQKRSVDHASHR